jgi:hypothetical protein
MKKVDVLFMGSSSFFFEPFMATVLARGAAARIGRGDGFWGDDGLSRD